MPSVWHRGRRGRTCRRSLRDGGGRGDGPGEDTAGRQTGAGRQRGACARGRASARRGARALGAPQIPSSRRGRGHARGVSERFGSEEVGETEAATPPRPNGEQRIALCRGSSCVTTNRQAHVLIEGCGWAAGRDRRPGESHSARGWAAGGADLTAAFQAWRRQGPGVPPRCASQVPREWYLASRSLPSRALGHHRPMKPSP